LIQGESETGKELVSRAVYQHSTRSHKLFLIINGDSPQPANEVAALELSIHGLLKYTEQVHQDLKKSQDGHGATFVITLPVRDVRDV